MACANGLPARPIRPDRPRGAPSGIERAIVVFIVDEQHADELLADIDLGRVVFLRPRHDADLGIAEHALQIRVKLPDFLNVHDLLP